MNEAISVRVKKLLEEFTDACADINKSGMKLSIEQMFETDKFDRAKMGHIRDISDHYIRIGSLLRRMCDLIEPEIEDEENERRKAGL